MRRHQPKGEELAAFGEERRATIVIVTRLQVEQLLTIGTPEKLF